MPDPRDSLKKAVNAQAKALGVKTTDEIPTKPYKEKEGKSERSER